MRSLQGFSDAAAPVFTDLGKAAPSLTDATRTLTPFSEATTVALKSLGKAGEASGPIFREAEPIVRKAAELAKSGVSPTTELAKLFTSIKQTEGWNGLVELIYNTTAALNGFDQYGHFGRTPGHAHQLHRLHRERPAAAAARRDSPGRTRSEGGARPAAVDLSA